MNQQIFVSAAILFVLAQTAWANPVSRRATITGGGGNGRCTVQVSVDHTAEVEVSGDMACSQLRRVSRHRGDGSNAMRRCPPIRWTSAFRERRGGDRCEWSRILAGRAGER